MDNTTAETVANGLEKARRSGDGWTACCPAHDDKNPSLSITDGVDGRVLVKCHKGCSQEDVIAELKGRGLWPERRNGKVVSVSQPYMGNRETTSKGVLRRYPYYRPDGVLHVEVCMYRDSATGKKVGRRPWREPSGVKAPHPLYRVRELPERPADPVLVVEGEHTVEHAAEHFPDYLVTTSIGGSSQAGETDWTPLADRAVVIWPDADAGGIEHAEKVSKLATAAGAASVRIVELPVLPAKWDLADPVPPGVDVRAILEHREELKSIRLDVVAKRIENLVNPLSWHRDRDPEPQEAMKLADANGRPALVAVEGGGQPEGATEATGFAPLPRRDKASLESALSQLGIDVRYNLRTSSHEWNRGGGWAPANDRVDDDIRELIAASFKIAHNERPALYGRERWVTSLNSILHGREVDPFRTWIEALPAWDKVERLSTWLGRAFRTNDDALSRWCSRYVFLGAVERTYKPGSKLDVLPVLVGPQGAGKSSVLALAFPEDRPEWFSDQLNLAADPKVRAEALQGVVMVEVAEMTGSTRAEIQSLKAFLSRTNDGGIRLAWRRNPEPMPRRCILIPRSRVLLDTRLIHDSWRKGCRDERTKARGGFGGGRP